MRIYQQLQEIQHDGYIVTVHVSPDCKPETLQALGEMMKNLIEQVENGWLGKGQPSGEYAPPDLHISKHGKALHDKHVRHARR